MLLQPSQLSRKQQQLHNAGNCLLFLLSREGKKKNNQIAPLQIRAAQTVPVSIWPSLTSRNDPKVSARQYLTFLQSKPNEMSPHCRVLVDPGGFLGLVGGTSMAGEGRTGNLEQDLGCGEANSLLRAAPGILQHPGCSGGWCKAMGLLRNVLFTLLILKRAFSF